MTTILNHTDFQQKITDLSQMIASKYPKRDDVVFVGIQQGGVALADEIVEELQQKDPQQQVLYGQLDITFYRDDIRQEILAPDTMNIPFSIEDKIVVLIDDVLFTGRTIKAALDVLLDYGRPAKVELCVLIDRKEHRQFPIQADYVGLTVATEKKDKVKLVKDDKGEKHVVLMN
ncbi:MAG TPA: bifunctional pyr operon transcriptional regulator/uracil phosphoribosyltransferase PyrR [Ferruginibacter sp.]|nr:bifunctional pyr operon transcriptional regulator/uracil phosphoribosyltransferase PyrR [Ferruginibacter sp.]